MIKDVEFTLEGIETAVEYLGEAVSSLSGCWCEDEISEIKEVIGVLEQKEEEYLDILTRRSEEDLAEANRKYERDVADWKGR